MFVSFKIRYGRRTFTQSHILARSSNCSCHQELDRRHHRLRKERSSKYNSQPLSCLVPSPRLSPVSPHWLLTLSTHFFIRSARSTTAKAHASSAMDTPTRATSSTDCSTARGSLIGLMELYIEESLKTMRLRELDVTSGPINRPMMARLRMDSGMARASMWMQRRVWSIKASGLMVWGTDRAH